MANLTNKIALVTGGSRGIGAGIAKRLATDGASVAITYSKGSEAAAAVEKTIATYGRLDVFVNSAGTAIPKPFLETTLEELDSVINLNFRGAMIATQAALRHMQKGGRIILIGSCVGERMMTPGLVPYAATKGAIKMFTQGLAREIGGQGITVNNVQPGPIDTELNPAAGDWATPQIANTALGRYGQVEEIAAMVAFLAGPEAAYITGANMTVDGGTNA
jgi:3-oxoacyl-[acyl-carrier protein] reductase